MSCKLLEKKYFAKFLRFAKIFQTCLAKPSQYVANSQISQKQLHKCEGEEEALVRSDLLGLSSKSGAQVNFLWETSGQVVENQFGRRTNNLNKKTQNLQSCQNTLPIQDKFKQRQIQRDETKLGSNESSTSEKKNSCSINPFNCCVSVRLWSCPHFFQQSKQSFLNFEKLQTISFILYAKFFCIVLSPLQRENKISKTQKSKQQMIYAKECDKNNFLI